MRLTKRQKENLSKALFDIGKLTFVTVVLGRFISEKPLNLLIIILGALFVLLCFTIAIYLDKGE